MTRNPNKSVAVAGPPLPPEELKEAVELGEVELWLGEIDGDDISGTLGANTTGEAEYGRGMRVVVRLGPNARSNVKMNPWVAFANQIRIPNQEERKNIRQCCIIT
jgi:hypothetical protein